MYMDDIKFSLWCDFLERDFINGEFLNLIQNSTINGATSNPAIFKSAICSSNAYEEMKNDYKRKSPKELYEILATSDIKNAANKLLKNYADGDDGFVTFQIDTASDDAMKEKLRVMVGGGDVPDIYYSWSGEFAAKFVRAGVAVDLTAYQEADPEWKSSISEVYWDDGDVDGADYGVPFRFTGGAMMYNKGIFQELGLSEPTTWGEFENVCQKLLDAGYTPMMYGNAQPWISAWWFTALFEQMVPQDIRETDYNADTGEWTDEGYVKALALMQEMQNKGYLNDNINSMTDDQATEMFAAGMGGMFYTGLYNFDPMDEKMGSENWDWFPFPSLEDAVGRTNTVVGASDLFIVSSQSEHPEVAVDFLKFLTSKENQTRLPAETWLTPVVEGSSTQDNSSAKELDFIEYVANESNGFSEYLDTATDARVCDVLLENFQLLYDGKAPEEIMKEVQQIAKTVREEG